MPQVAASFMIVIYNHYIFMFQATKRVIISFFQKQKFDFINWFLFKLDENFQQQMAQLNFFCSTFLSRSKNISHQFFF